MTLLTRARSPNGKQDGMLPTQFRLVVFVRCFHEFRIYKFTIFFVKRNSFKVASKCLFCENKYVVIDTFFDLNRRILSFLKRICRFETRENMSRTCFYGKVSQILNCKGSCQSAKMIVLTEKKRNKKKSGFREKMWCVDYKY